MTGPEKGVITKGVFSLDESLESLESLKSLKSLEPLGNGRVLLCYPCRCEVKFRGDFPVHMK